MVTSFKVEHPLGLDLEGCNLFAIETLDKKTNSDSVEMKLYDSLMLAAELIRQWEIRGPISQIPALGTKEFRSKTGGKGGSANKIKR